MMILQVMWAFAAHAVATLVAYTNGADARVWDVGHALFPSISSAEPLVHVLTFLVPALALTRAPPAARYTLSSKSVHAFAWMVALRSAFLGLTILPPLTPIRPLTWASFVIGAGRDYVFSGHAAFVASATLVTSYYQPVWMWALVAVHSALLVATRMHYSLDVVLAWAVCFAMVPRPSRPLLEMASVHDRPEIYRARHDIYATELGQYPETPCRQLRDYTDDHNAYIVARKDGAIHGFVAITPPGSRRAMERHGVLPTDPSSYEIRLLGVVKGCRGHGVARALSTAAVRYVQASGGTCVEIMARTELVGAYEKAGYKRVASQDVAVGSVSYAHMFGHARHVLARLGTPRHVQWNLPFGIVHTTACTHGGRGLETLRATKNVNADVLDAWFEPAPRVLECLAENVGVTARTTPPAAAHELVDAVAEARGVPRSCILLGAGSSDLMYRAFWTWLRPSSRVLLVTPTYAEYEHLLGAIGCRVVRMRLGPDTGYRLESLRFSQAFDLVVVVNPNSPTGAFVRNLGDVLCGVRASRVWVDETYIDYVCPDASLESHVMRHPRLIVCKSMSKAYALSGLRVGYLCAHPTQLETLRTRTPPWMVSRLAQRAAVEALASPQYYSARYAETHVLRSQLGAFLQSLGWTLATPGCANFVMASPPLGTSVVRIVSACSSRGVFVRRVDNHWVRISVCGVSEQDRLMKVMESVCSGLDAVQRGVDEVQ